jgi:hypothetical protein
MTLLEGRFVTDEDCLGNKRTSSLEGKGIERDMDGTVASLPEPSIIHDESAAKVGMHCEHLSGCIE